MKRWCHYIFVVVCCLPLAMNHAAAEGLTEAQVKGLIRQVQAAVHLKSADKLKQAFTPDAVIETIESTARGEEREQHSLEGYLSICKIGWATIKNYRYLAENINIQITADGSSATIKSDVIESGTVGGIPLRQTSHEENFVVLQNGRPLIKRVVARIKINP